MRRFSWMVLFVVSSGWLAAQVPGSPPTGVPLPPAVAPTVPAAPPVDPILMQHLTNWETVMKGAKNFYAKGKYIEEDKVRKIKTESESEVMCLLPNLARMREEKLPLPNTPKNPQDYTAYIATGNSILEYDGLNLTLTETKLAPGSSKGVLILDFLSGTMTAKEIVTRFQTKILGEDNTFLYLELTALNAEDKSDFDTLVVVLFRNIPNQPAYLPRQIVARLKNGQIEKTWDYPTPAINVNGVLPQYFERVPVDPKVWKLAVRNAPGRQAPPRNPAIPGNPAMPASIPGSSPVVIPTPGLPPKQ
jgi:TIGR03009 family protein